mmetsp:Transcript_16121/g.21077  ORF Transcript_16121/g.21077 Transcript_16121/m.21077 type:complete len:314 (-) Transcript_16121:565-1506(-)
MPFANIVLDIICPSVGVILANCLFAAPVVDLRRALAAGSLGDLNPFPWSVQSGNCLGWIIYGFYQHPKDPFLIAANIPGFLTSIWLNLGAAKLQYLQELEEQAEREQLAAAEAAEAALSQHNGPTTRTSAADADDSHASENNNYSYSSIMALLHVNSDYECFAASRFALVQQERSFFAVLIFWALIVIWVAFFDPKHASMIVGLLVNVNLVFFYGAPLLTIQKVILTNNSISIHRPTMYMNWACSSFWTLYGVTQLDPIIMFPNAIGLSLGMAQGVLAATYPVHSAAPERRQSLLETPLLSSNNTNSNNEGNQ